MSHPYAKNIPGRATAYKRYAEGGLVELLKEEADAYKEDLDSSMRAKSRGKSDQFWDTGNRIPGRGTAKNYEYDMKRYGKSRIVKD